MENLNAEQVKKALECCADCGNCKECPYDGMPYTSSKDRCTYNLTRDALALINSQEQRIKELTEENANLHASCTEFERKCASLNDECAKAKADAVREMQKKIKARKFTHKNFGDLVYVEDIDQIAKEIAEGERSDGCTT